MRDNWTITFLLSVLFRVSDKLRMFIFRCAAPLVSILFDFPIKIVATLWLNFEVHHTGNLFRILSGGVLKVQRTEISDASFFNQYLPNSCTRNVNL